MSINNIGKLKFEDSFIVNYDSFEDFSKNLSLALKNKKTRRKYGRVFERLCQIYLLNEPKYSSIAKNVWLLDQVPLSIKKLLNIPLKRDEGIDLIFETKNKEYWAIQSKFLSNTNATLTRTKLNNFHSLSFVHCKNIVHSIVISTISKPPVKKDLLDNVGYILIDEFISLDNDKNKKWRELKNKIKGKSNELIPSSPRPYQKKILKKLRNKFQYLERGKLLMPCGTGKSLVGYFLAQELSFKNILICVPSLYLVNQTLKVWVQELLAIKKNLNYLCVCSDETVDKIDSDTYVDSINDLGVKVTTKQEEIKNFLKTNLDGVKVLITTYQSGKITSSASKSINFTFDLGIFDEAHKTVGHMSKTMSHMLFKENINIKKRLFMTATERIYGGKDDEILSMENNKIYGDVLYNLTFKEAIKNKAICDYKIIGLEIQKSEIKEIIQDNLFLKIKNDIGLGNNQFTNNNEYLARELVTAIAYKKAAKKYKIKKGISFHNSIIGAKRFKDILYEIETSKKSKSQFKIFHTSSKENMTLRKVNMKEFESCSNGIITNARCLTEGVDIPAVDCVCFVDPKKSKVDIVQATGRAMRNSKNKPYGYVIVPVIYDEIDEKNIFKDIVDVIGSLSLQDERLYEEIQSIVGKKSKRNKKIIENINVNSLKNISLDTFNKNISINVWKKIKKFNFMNYERARTFVVENGLKSVRQYENYLQANPDVNLPASPSVYYKNQGFVSYPIFFGNVSKKSSSKSYVSYEEAKKEVRKENIKSWKEWKSYSKTKRPYYIPGKPNKFYKEFQQDDFFGNVSKVQKLDNPFSLENLRKIIILIDDLDHYKKWKDWVKINQKNYKYEIPLRPESFYKDEWKGWDYLLNSKEKRKRKEFLTFDELKECILFSKAKNKNEFDIWATKKAHIYKKKKIPKNLNFYSEYNSKKLF